MVKILLANKFFYLDKPDIYPELSCMNFSSTYAKFFKTYKSLNQLFEVILERNEKPGNGRAFWFLRSASKFFGGKKSIDFIFQIFRNKSYVLSKEIDVENTQEEVEKMLANLKLRNGLSLIKLSPFRGIGRTGVSLKDKDLGMLRIKDLSIVKSGYNPITNVIKN